MISNAKSATLDEDIIIVSSIAGLEFEIMMLNLWRMPTDTVLWAE